MINVTIINNYSIKLKNIEINFKLRNNFIYHIKKKNRLYISKLLKKIIIKIAYDDYFHANYYKIYIKLSNTIYIHKFLRKLIIYIRYCFIYQLN